MTSKLQQLIAQYEAGKSGTLDIEGGLLALKRQGVGMDISLKVLKEAENLSFSEAKEMIWNSNTWQQEAKNSQPLVDAVGKFLSEQKQV